MSKNSSFSIGRILLQIALGLLLTVAGIWTFMGGGDEGVSAIKNVIDNKTLETILIYAYGVIEVISGVFLILSLFIGDRLGAFGNILMIIIMIVCFAKVDRPAALMQVPYLLWVTFAAYLNWGVYILN